MFRRLINIVISLMRRKKRRLILLCVWCWLLFSAQLALASHHCAIAFSCMAVASEQQHNQHMLTQTPLCDKHCAPDLSPDDHPSLHMVAVAADPGLRLAVCDVAAKKFQFDWLRPPVTGPPAEIRFCRFRE
ncbi:hypothetical protein J2125_004583 [Erwinia toletana]|uniref:Uncharacterized protein n=1 Tax=Winslowiella toletana TaxID=92490 RepID=A0ABS4PFG7_9GAMM|nr:hypothetical protein [Winslowiella toletana]MBP2171391.1 hypothetical protein [Winslowiella toletana]